MPLFNFRFTLTLVFVVPRLDLADESLVDDARELRGLSMPTIDETAAEPLGLSKRGVTGVVELDSRTDDLLSKVVLDGFKS